MATAKKTTSGSQKLDRSKLRRPASVPETGDTSVRSIVFLTLLVVLVAVVGAYIVKNYQSSEVVPPVVEDIVEDVVVEEVEPEEDGKSVEFSSDILDTSSLSNVPAAELFGIKDSVIGNKATENKFQLMGIIGQAYTDLYKLTFEFKSEDSNSKDQTPYSDANYRATLGEIELTFEATTDETGVILGEVLSIDDSIVKSLVKSMNSDDEESIYKINLPEETDYVMVEEGSKVAIYILGLDVVLDEEETEDMEEDALEEDVDQPEEEATSMTGDGITSEATGKVAGVKGHSFDDSTTSFRYMLKLSNTQVPNVKSEIKTEGGESVLYVSIENLVFDGIASNDEYGEISFADKGVIGVDSLSSDFTDGTSEYRFTLTGSNEYKIFLNDVDYDENRIVIEFVH